jgi:hypothetical protein
MSVKGEAVKKFKFLIVEAELVWMQAALAKQECRQTQRDRRAVRLSAPGSLCKVLKKRKAHHKPAAEK